MALLSRNLFVGALLSVAFLAFSTPASAQGTTCNLKLNVGSFIEGTIDIKPVEGVSVTLIDVKNGQPVIAGPASDHLYETLSSGEYKVSASRAGYRTTNDIITLDCAVAFQGLAERVVAMWEGDPSKSVNYTKIDHSYDKKPSKNRPTDKPIKLGTTDEEESSSQAPAEPVIRAGSTITKGVINGSAVVMAKPKYPATAKAVGASGAVSVQVLIDEDGYVIAAEAVTGHPLLKGVSALAAKASKFMPTFLSGTKVKVSGIIVYNFQ
ncbi:MAG TPA: energy transducer TonB [Pyrinomonadaceae bacterium]|jgi:hypothetical protein|nr:energy transducer TonB [Pyrinomonadaceae bacterium]